jgi:two-component system sensor histidine kinase PilS (NtrC family)
MPARSPGAAATLRRRLLWTIAVRAVAASVLLGSAVLLRIDAGPAGAGADAYFVLIAVTYALTGLYAATARFVERHPWLVDGQLSGDILLISAVVLLSGGVHSHLPSLYVLPIVGAGALRMRRGGLMAALLGIACYATVVAGQYSGSFGRLAVPLPELADAFYRVTMNGAGFLAVAFLTGSLAEGWHRADLRLASASSAIANLQAFNQCVIDSLPGGVLTTDEEGRILTVNRAAESITGRTTRDMLGRAVDDVLELPGGGVIALAGKDSARIEFEYMKPSATRIVVGLGLAPLRVEGRKPGYVFTFQDVTELKRREYEAQLQKRLAAIGEMAAGIAHEIRNPLASMSGSMQVLRRELELSDEQALLMDIVLRESERLNDTIRNFLAYARPHRLLTARLGLARLVRETALLLRNSPELGERHDIVMDLPERDVVCDGDEAQLRQVVWNLASNALRAMPDGGTLTLALTLEPQPGRGDRAVLSVADTGVGMSKDQQESLFQPFSGGFARGVGLGLAIAHRIVADHGGTIAVRSVAGQGTSVTVALPAAPEPEAMSPVAASEPRRETPVTNAA